MDQGWSLKRLHRQIVTSATYRQSSRIRSDVADPYNRLLARQSRLRMEAETIRDAALTAGGLLSHRIGGPSVHPPQPAGVFAFTQDPKPWEPTPEIISAGVYRFTRNPMYVGMALLQTGIGLALVSAWIIALAPVVLAVVYVTAVRHEEAYLEEKFGAAYLNYKSSVRRWI